MKALPLSIDAPRVVAELESLAAFSVVASPAVTRVVFSDEDLAARQYLTDLFVAAGLAVRSDAVGNLFARWEGREPALPAIGTGSHCDAIPHSGRFDGTVGVLGGLEAIRALQATDVQPRRSIELLMFTSEEPTRFGMGCLGSRLLSGTLAPADADALVDEHHDTLATVRTRAGFTGDLAAVRLPSDHYHKFVELHIEQGPLLERDGIDLGAVTAIAAPAALRVKYAGPGGHAGAVLMADRRDPLLPAARLALEVDAAARGSGAADTVATVGVLDVHPRAVNSIPRQVMLEIDVRDIDGSRRDATLQRIQAAAVRFGDGGGCPAQVELLNSDPPATCDPAIVAAIEQSAHDAGRSCQQMISRAYHDSLFMSLVCPTAMIFIPCRDGISHRPEEFASESALAGGVEALARTLWRLAEEG
ncbi:MAG: M20 family metallo-hydrolase [Planctomycetales bacterium]|nr:M20 family metallo-hydrolase [Planctomycetales bacterium]